MGEHFAFILGEVSNPVSLAYLIAGNLIGMVFGAIPGLNGTFAVLMFMPLTYTMPTSQAVILLMSLWIGGCSGGFIGSVLLGIPGSPASVATCFDGYPMAQKGQVRKALSIGMTASFMGTFTSAILGVIFSQTIAMIAFRIGVWEYAALSLMAITLVLAMSKGDMFKGLVSAALGLLIGCVGFSPLDSVQRFTFGNMYLISGFSINAVLIGLFAMTLVMVEFGQGFKAAPDIEMGQMKGFGIGLKIKEITDHARTIIRSMAIGLFIGFLPGLGSALSNLLAYSSAKNASKHPETFGEGDPEGIWAPEVANNAAIGGSMIPMAALGIPGDSTTALLISALTIHGLQMGPMVFKNSGNIVYLMFGAVALCAIVCLILQIFGVRFFPSILKLPKHYLYPAVLMLCIIGGYIDSYNMFTCYAMLGFAVLGVLMNYGKIPTSPLILALVLEKTLETNLLKGFQYSGTVTSFFTRPLSGIMMIIVIASIFSPVLKMGFTKIKKK